MNSHGVVLGSHLSSKVLNHACMPCSFGWLGQYFAGREQVNYLYYRLNWYQNAVDMHTFCFAVCCVPYLVQSYLGAVSICLPPL